MTLEPWFPNVSKRFVKSPKVFQTDSGILHTWLNLPDTDSLLGSSALGTSWEGYVINQIKSIAGDRLGYFFYRTHQGAECDLVLVKGDAPVAGIEIKFSPARTLEKGFFIAVEDLKTPKNFVIVAGTTDYEARKNHYVVNLSSFLKNYLPELL